MSETQAVPGDFNPYAVENMPEGGGLTREVIVTSAKYVTYPMQYKDGTPVKDSKTGQPSFFTGLRIDAIRVGGEEGKTEKYEFSAGKKCRPSADGEMLLGEDGKPAKIFKTSNLGKATNKLRDGGFAVETLYPRVSVLAGARLVLAGENKIGADGKPKTHTYNGKEYNDLDWYPESYKGHVGGVAAQPGAPAADVELEAEQAIVAILQAAGGSAERKDVIKGLGTNLKDSPNAIRITTLAARADFHSDARPWRFDAATSTLTLK